jgi:hypothetical protein
MMRPGSLLRSLSFLLLLPRLAAADPLPNVPNGERDYLFPPRDPRQAAGILPGKSGERVQYQAFDGAVYTLNRFPGRHVALLLPDSWLGEGELTPDRVRTFVDRSDLLYESFKGLIGREPGPADRLLTIAVVRTCGFGCGYVGAKGIEISPDAGALSLVQPDLAAGLVPGVVAHEMAHNFDFWNARLGHWGDFAHAWTRFFDHYIFVYDRQGRPEEGPDEVLRRLERETFGAYLADPSLSWGSCVRDGVCSTLIGRVDRNGAWAGTLWRLARLHGPQAVRGYARFLAGYAGPEPGIPEEKNDLHVEALAAGAAADLGCYVDAWRWHASPAARDRMTAAFGPGNPFCDDLDGDGRNRLSGDCDEGDAGRFPAADELTNDVDDDCDGVVDDLTAEEPFSGDFPDLEPVPFPGNVRGSISGWQDADRFLLDLPSPRRVRIDLCSRPDFGGWLFVHREDGSWLGYQYAPRGGCSTRAYSLDRAGEWTFSVELNADSQPGGYEVALYDAEPRPAVGGEGGEGTSPGGFYTLTPCRMLDTRDAADGPALASGDERTVMLHGRCGVPPTARALAVNITVVQPAGAGHLALYPAGSPPPLASAINFRPGKTRANNAILPLGTDGAAALQAHVEGGGAVQVLVDVSGYFE